MLVLADGTRYDISAMTEAQVGELGAHASGALGARDGLGKFDRYLM